MVKCLVKTDRMVILFSLYSIVDDSEMYEQQKPFRLDELVKISAFLNNLVFKMLWNEMNDGRFRVCNNKITVAMAYATTTTTITERRMCILVPRVSLSPPPRAAGAGRERPLERG